MYHGNLKMYCSCPDHNIYCMFMNYRIYTRVQRTIYLGYRLNLLLLVFSHFFSSTFFLDMHIAGYYAIIGIKVETIVTFLTKILLKYKSTDTFKYKMVLKVIT